MCLQFRLCVYWRSCRDPGAGGLERVVPGNELGEVTTGFVLSVDFIQKAAEETVKGFKWDEKAKRFVL